MKGTVLSVDRGAGLLRAEDGKRYSFSAGEWKSPQPPAAGDHVDFEPSGATATAIYTVKAGAAPVDVAALKASLAKAAETAAKSNVGATLLGDWRPCLAAATLIACLFPYASLGPQSASLISTVSRVGEAIDAFSVVRSMGRGAPDFGGVIFALRFTYLLWLIPILAAAVLFCTFTNRPLGKLPLAHGAASVAVPILVAIFASIAIAASIPPELRQLTGRNNPFNIGLFGIGAWLIIAIGAAQLAHHFGYLKKSPRELIGRS